MCLLIRRWLIRGSRIWRSERFEMKATEAKLLDFLKKSPQFVIPIYQRTYSWTERECQQLWDDILRAGSDDEIAAHFVGSIVYIEKGLYQVSSQSPLLVIDGQQRLTTVTLLLEALARTLGDSEPVDGFSATEAPQLLPAEPARGDGERALQAAAVADRQGHACSRWCNRSDLPRISSLRVAGELRLLRDELVASLEDDFDRVCKGLAKLVVVDIALSRDQDNPQLIFESMNSTGRELSQADLIRNFILMGLEPELQTRPLRGILAADGAGLRPGGLRHALRRLHAPLPHAEDRRDPERPRGLRGVQGACPTAGGGRSSGSTSSSATSARSRSITARWRSGQEPDKELGAGLPRPARAEGRRRLSVPAGAVPATTTTGILSKDDFVAGRAAGRGVRLPPCRLRDPDELDEQDVRHLPTALKKDRYLESIQAHLLSLPSYRRFPTRRRVQARAHRCATSTTSAAAATGCAGSRTTGARSACRSTSTRSSTSCRRTRTSRRSGSEALGPEWERIQQTWLHTLGNLTLTGYNSEYSDRPFAEKRDMTGGFKESPLRLNEGLGGSTPGTRPRSRRVPGELAERRVRRLGRAQACRPTCSRRTRRPERPPTQLHHRRPRAPRARTADARALRGLPQGGAGARSVL